MTQNRELLSSAKLRELYLYLYIYIYNKSDLALMHRKEFCDATVYVRYIYIYYKNTKTFLLRIHGLRVKSLRHI